MRLNKFVALATGLSRRTADEAIIAQRVRVNEHTGQLGEAVNTEDRVSLDDRLLQVPETQLIMLNKPVGYVCSRAGQGSHTIYDLLPAQYHHLKPVGRLDKDSSGLLLLTNDGQLAHSLTHPRFVKSKVYEIELDKPLQPADRLRIERGIKLDDGPSKLQLEGEGKQWIITMQEGRNRQIRRTFAAQGLRVTALHRSRFGLYTLGKLKFGQWQKLKNLL